MEKSNIDNKLINELINEAVWGYKTLSYKYLDEVKTLVFTYLLNGFSYEEFEKKLDALGDKYNIKINSKYNKDINNIRNKSYRLAMKGNGGRFQISKEELDSLKYKLDKNSPIRARAKYDKVIKHYYLTTSKNLKKAYIDKDTYLTRAVTKYDKVEKVVPYYSKDTGKIISYHDIADYNSMVYNTNLTSTAWNATFDACVELNEDIVYVEPHPYACPNCQLYQGRFYSITGKSLSYPSLDIAVEGGLKHPNCKHILTTYYGQEETDKYSGSEYEKMYDNRQKLNAVNLSLSRLENDKQIYAQIGNQEMAEKTENKILRLLDERTELRKLTKIKG